MLVVRLGRVAHQMTQAFASLVVFVGGDVASLMLRELSFAYVVAQGVAQKVHSLMTRLLDTNLREKCIDPLGIWLFAEQTLTVDEIMCLDVGARDLAHVIVKHIDLRAPMRRRLVIVNHDGQRFCHRCE